MTRIVAGAAGGRRLRVPAGSGTRPTPDRVREALFGSLEAAGDLAGARVLDLYAGTGALGLEARSRGAAHVRCVEADRRALDVLRANAAATGLAGVAVTGSRVERLLAGPCPEPPYDLLLADPPYALAAADLAGVLTAAVAGGWLAPAAAVVLERSARDARWVWPEGFAADRDRGYGEVALWYGRRA